MEGARRLQKHPLGFRVLLVVDRLAAGGGRSGRPSGLWYFWTAARHF